MCLVACLVRCVSSCLLACFLVYLLVPLFLCFFVCVSLTVCLFACLSVCVHVCVFACMLAPRHSILTGISGIVEYSGFSSPKIKKELCLIQEACTLSLKTDLSHKRRVLFHHGVPTPIA